MLKRNIKLVFITNALMLCSGVVTSLLSAWSLGPEGRGDLMVALMWPGVFAMFAEFGLPTAYRFWAAKQIDNVSQYFSNAVLLAGSVGLLTFAIAWFLIPHIIGVRSPQVVWLAQVYAVIIPMSLLTDMSRGLLEGARRFQWVGAVRLIFFAVQLITYIVLWAKGQLTLANALYTMIAAALTSLGLVLFSIWYELRPKWQPRMSGFITTIRYGMRDYPGVLTEFVNWRLDWIMLVAFAPSAAIGLYSVAVRLSDITTVLASSVGDALMPEVAATKIAADATRIVTRSLRVTLTIHLLILVPLFLAAPYILQYAYGDGFVPVTNVLRLLMVASVIWSSGAIVISGLNGLGHPGLSAVARICAALVMIAALIAWLPTRGIVGAALSSITGYSVMFVVALFWLLRRGKVSLWDCLRPRWSDFPILSPTVLRIELSKFLGRERQTGTPTAEAVIGGIE